MATITMTGADTVTINNRVFADFADGDCTKLVFPNDVAEVKTGKNGNSIYALNETGRQCELELMLLRASADDKFLNALFAQQRNNFSGFPLMIGTFIKKAGDGKGIITSDTYILAGGVFVRAVDAKTNVNGDTTQSVAIWRMKFANAPRAIT